MNKDWLQEIRERLERRYECCEDEEDASYLFAHIDQLEVECRRLRTALEKMLLLFDTNDWYNDQVADSARTALLNETSNGVPVYDPKNVHLLKGVELRLAP